MKNLRNYKSILERRNAIEKQRKVDLKHIGSFTLDEMVASTRNCENMIGATQVPLGIAGPLRLSEASPLRIAHTDYYVPLATTEGALVASVNRGCKAITESGGAAVDSYRVGATRGPVFKVNNLKESDKLNRFLEEHFTDLQTIAKTTSRHLTLTKYMDRGVGKYRYVRFVFDTRDAMGMNMVTIATQKLVEFIETKTFCRCISLAGNYDVDKKPSWLNVIEGRGTKAWAEVTLTKKVLTTILKTTAQKAYDVWLGKCMMGSAMSGSMAFNAQFANVVAALFLATGQDLGHVGEGSLGMTTTEIINGKDLYVSVYLPDLMVGKVGGGTGLATQHEALKLLGVENSQKFAEIVAGAVLAGEISLLASLSEGTLAKAHKILARGGK
jgi:hydroxymethylglutaryl-CoA reductase (NADPH)